VRCPLLMADFATHLVRIGANGAAERLDVELDCASDARGFRSASRLPQCALQAARAACSTSALCRGLRV